MSRETRPDLIPTTLIKARDRLVEEIGEVLVEIGHCQRFGLLAEDPATGKKYNNGAALLKELDDLADAIASYRLFALELPIVHIFKAPTEIAGAPKVIGELPDWQQNMNCICPHDVELCTWPQCGCHVVTGRTDKPERKQVRAMQPREQCEPILCGLEMKGAYKPCSYPVCDCYPRREGKEQRS